MFSGGGCLLRSLLLVGKSGSGKSSLCNRIASPESRANIFPVSSKPGLCTTRATIAEVLLGGDSEKPTLLMDTPGFDEQHTEDYKTEMELLKTKMDQINLVGIIINGQTPRVDASFLKMVDVLEDIFGPTFFSRSVVIFTKIAMDSKAKAKRLKNTGKTDEEFAQEFLKDLHKRFLPAEVPFLFLDSFFDNKNQDEAKEFQHALDHIQTLVTDYTTKNFTEDSKPVASNREGAHPQNRVSLRRKRFRKCR